jgi:hypothetical protein
LHHQLRTGQIPTYLPPHHLCCQSVCACVADSLANDLHLRPAVSAPLSPSLSLHCLSRACFLPSLGKWVFITYVKGTFFGMSESGETSNLTLTLIPSLTLALVPQFLTLALLLAFVWVCTRWHTELSCVIVISISFFLSVFLTFQNKQQQASAHTCGSDIMMSLLSPNTYINMSVYAAEMRTGHVHQSPKSLSRFHVSHDVLSRVHSCHIITHSVIPSSKITHSVTSS